MRPKYASRSHPSMCSLAFSATTGGTSRDRVSRVARYACPNPPCPSRLSTRYWSFVSGLVTICCGNSRALPRAARLAADIATVVAFETPVVIRRVLPARRRRGRSWDLLARASVWIACGSPASIRQPMQPQRLREEHGHLLARQRRIRTEVAVPASGGDAGGNECLDVGKERVRRRDVGESRRRRRRADLPVPEDAHASEVGSAEHE